MIIKIILILSLLFILIYFLNNRKSSNVKATKKIMALIFFGWGIFAIFFPDQLTYLASLVGVGRGTDLMLYLFLIFSLFVFIDIYLTKIDIDKKVSVITRKIALIEKKLNNSDNDKIQ